MACRSRPGAWPPPGAGAGCAPGAARRSGVAAAPQAAALLLACAVVAAGCSRSDDPVRPRPTRTYAMGFSWFPPRPDLALALQVVDLWRPRADQALILDSPPWDSLLAGRSPDSLIRANQMGQAQYFRARGLRVIVSIDPTDGLDRSKDAPALVAAGRSLAEPAVQALLRHYVVAMDTLLRPDALGFASETNLVRAIAPAALYGGLRQAAGDAAAAVRAADPAVTLFATVQVEVAWGRPSGAFVGLAQDLADFPFVQRLGLSSYPFLGGYADPDSLPLDYYARLVQGTPLPLMVIEGGWPSEPHGAAASTPEMQRRYIARHARLLDEAGAVGWFQITYTDLDVPFWPAGIEPFSRLGLVSTALEAKPALAAWDEAFARARR